MGKDLRLALCLDDGGGMLFGGRRQSRDSLLIKELLSSTEGKIYITPFSSVLFEEHSSRVETVDNPFLDAPNGSTVFIENIDIAPYEQRIGEIILYKWNRVYPRDKRIDIDLTRYKVLSKRSFVGSSHARITRLKLKKVDQA
jgi:hypothetical protein